MTRVQTAEVTVQPSAHTADAILERLEKIASDHPTQGTSEAREPAVECPFDRRR